MSLRNEEYVLRVNIQYYTYVTPRIWGRAQFHSISRRVAQRTSVNPAFCSLSRSVSLVPFLRVCEFCSLSKSPSASLYFWIFQYFARSPGLAVGTHVCLSLPPPSPLTILRREGVSIGHGVPPQRFLVPNCRSLHPSPIFFRIGISLLNYGPSTYACQQFI